MEKYSLNLETIINKRRIIDNKNSCHSNSHDIVCQVFFIPKNNEYLEKAKQYELSLNKLPFDETHIKLICNIIYQNFDIYLLGWTDKKNLHNIKETFSVKNSESNSIKREYGNFFIKNAFNNCDLINFLKNQHINHIKIK